MQIKTQQWALFLYPTIGKNYSLEDSIKYFVHVWMSGDIYILLLGRRLL